MSVTTPDSTDDAWGLGSVDTNGDTAAASEALSWWAKVGLTGLFFSLLAPLVGLAGLWTAAGLGQLAALGLETSRAKLPMIAMTPSWDLRVVYAFAVAVLGVRVVASALPRPRWKVAGLGPWGLWLLLGGVLWTTAGTTLALEQQVVDLADGIHLVVLSGAALWTSATATWLLGSTAHVVLVGARVAARRSVLASGGIAVLGIAGMAVVTPVLANPEAVQREDVYRDAPVLGTIREDLEEAGSRLAANVADESPPAGRELGASAAAGHSRDPNGLFASCMQTIVETPPGQGSSVRDAVTRMVSAKYPWVANDEVQDLVHARMIDICADGRTRSKDDLQAVLYRSTRNLVVSSGRKLRAQRNYWSRNRCLIDKVDDDIAVFEDQQHRQVTVARLMAELPGEKRALLQERFFDGVGYDEMAVRRGKRIDSIRKATNRALHSLRELLAEDCK